MGLAAAEDAAPPEPLPGFAELEAAGAVIGDVRIVNDNIFDLDDPKENNALFRLANALHVRTKQSVIRRTLLFKSGDRLSRQKVEETERLLLDNNYIYSVDIRPYAWHDGVVDIEVRTRDTWTIQPGFHFSRSGGSNSTGLSLEENNLLGTGISVGYLQSSDVDRSGTEFNVLQHHAFGGWTDIGVMVGDYSDGRKASFEFGRPFYALDTRWAAGATGMHDEQVESIYRDGAIVGQYRHQQDKGEVYGGWSRGLVDGWTHRYSAGLDYRDDLYSTDPSLVAPSLVPPDEKLVTPFLRYEVMQDNYEKVTNRNKIQRPEFFALGFSSTVQVGRALTALGSTRDAWIYSAKIADGAQAPRGNDLLGNVAVTGQYDDGRAERLVVNSNVRYYVPQGRRGLFYASASADLAKNPQPEDLLLLGGDNGLRGYPLRYQSGEHRAVLTVEERVYTDWYPFRLFRIGGAMFYDVGRAWGGPFQNPVNPGWLSDAGFGLRVLSDRSSYGNVVHADVAFPLNPAPGIQSVQFLVRTYANF